MCARGARARSLESIIGREELSEIERSYLRFGEAFDVEFLSQGETERRDISDTLERGWKTLEVLPESELGRLPSARRPSRSESRP